MPELERPDEGTSHEPLRHHPQQRSQPPADEDFVWNVICAACGATWEVTAGSMRASDDWIRCPRCGHGASEGGRTGEDRESP